MGWDDLFYHAPQEEHQSAPNRTAQKVLVYTNGLSYSFKRFNPNTKFMRTLLLTSAGTQVKDEIFKLFPHPKLTKLACIITASNPEEDKSYAIEDRACLVQEGFQVEDIDIEGKTEIELRNRLQGKNAIYVQGGNTFYLLKCANESGFGNVVRDLTNRGVVYIGVSAGTCIACPTIEMAAWEPADQNICNLKDLTAFNLVPFLVTPHYNQKYSETLKKEIALAKFPVRILTDDQAILVQNDIIRLVGKGEEIKL